MKFTNIENQYESAVRFESEKGDGVELVFDKDEQALYLGVYSINDPDGTLQTTQLTQGKDAQD